jgi:hypothetical protein
MEQPDIERMRMNVRTLTDYIEHLETENAKMREALAEIVRQKRGSSTALRIAVDSAAHLLTPQPAKETDDGE